MLSVQLPDVRAMSTQIFISIRGSSLFAQMFSLLHWAPCEPRPCLLCFIRPLQTNLPKRSGTQTQRRSCHPMLDKMDQSPVLSAHLGWMFPAVLWASEGRGVFFGGGRFRYSISVLSKHFGSCFPH